MIKIITDSSADLPKEIMEKYGIKVVPLTITIDNKEYIDGVTLSAPEFYQKMTESLDLPKTSQPSPASFIDAFTSYDADDEILCLTLSSQLSGTYQSASLAKEISGRNVTVFDSLSGSLGLGLMLIRAARLAKKGLSREEIVANLERYRDKINVIVSLDTLDNVIKGGRLSKFSGSLGKLLNIKVIVHTIEGRVEILDKVRGKKKLKNRMLDIIAERCHDFSEKTIGIAHTGNIEEAEEMKQTLIQRFNPKEIIVDYMGATIGTYAGRGGLLVTF